MTEGQKVISSIPVLGVIKHPRDGKHFIVPPEVAAVYGENPCRIDFMLPGEEVDAVFQEAYRRFVGGGGLRCIGSNGIGYDRDFKTGNRIQKTCPCEFLENKQCALTGAFYVLIPRVSLGGQFAIYTKSKRSSAMIRTTLKNLRDIYGRITGLQMTLNRVPVKIQYDKGKFKDYWMLNIVPPAMPATTESVASNLCMHSVGARRREDGDGREGLDGQEELAETANQQKVPMTEKQRTRLMKLMEEKGIGTSADKAAFFSHVLGDQQKTSDFARSFIMNFEENYRRWISSLMKEAVAS